MDSLNVKPNLVDALAQLEIGGQSRRRSFNKLPNELLRAILRRVQAHHLIRLRLVDNRWRAQIEDIWKDKKCMMIGQRWNKDYLSELCAQFNGHLKLSTDFVFIQLKYNGHECDIALSGQLCTLLSKLFPNIEQLYIIESVKYLSIEFTSMLRQWSSTLSTLSLFKFSNQNQLSELYAQLNQMINLKRLDLAIFSFMKELSPTFARLEHFSTGGYNVINEIVPFFGEGFCSLGLIFGWVNIPMISNWNSRFVRNLVWLRLSTLDPQVLLFICEHFTSLKMLRIEVRGCKFTTEMFANLARLTHLSELRIDGTHIDLATLDVAKLKPLSSIRTFSLEDFTFVNGRRVQCTLPANYDVSQFSRILSTILPNVIKLTVKSGKYPEIGNLFEAHLNRFVHLRSFNVEVDNSIVRLMN